VFRIRNKTTFFGRAQTVPDSIRDMSNNRPYTKPSLQKITFTEAVAKLAAAAVNGDREATDTLILVQQCALQSASASRALSPSFARFN
jgi:hypothetical protein